MLVTADRGRVPEVASLVLKPKGNQVVTGGATRASRRGTTEVSGRWPVVNVWELDAEALLAAGDPGLIPWVPLARTDRSTDDVLADCRDRIAGVADPRDRSGLAAVTVILAGLAYPGRNILSLFGGAEAMIESPVLDEVMDIVRKRERMAAVRESLIAFLGARFGPLPAGIHAVVTDVNDLGRLNDLVRQAATCPNMAAFAASIGSESL